MNWWETMDWKDLNSVMLLSRLYWMLHCCFGWRTIDFSKQLKQWQYQTNTNNTPKKKDHNSNNPNLFVVDDECDVDCDHREDNVDWGIVVVV
jgi:hypothetical protein